eukprot:RCo019873
MGCFRQIRLPVGWPKVGAPPPKMGHVVCPAQQPLLWSMIIPVSPGELRTLSRGNPPLWGFGRLRVSAAPFTPSSVSLLHGFLSVSVSLSAFSACGISGLYVLETAEECGG